MLVPSSLPASVRHSIVVAMIHRIPRLLQNNERPIPIALARSSRLFLSSFPRKPFKVGGQPDGRSYTFGGERVDKYLQTLHVVSPIRGLIDSIIFRIDMAPRQH